MPAMSRKPSIGIIFLTVFIDLIGFGIVVPMLQIFSRHLEASWLEIGLIMASFSAMQFIFSPIWGRLSDRIGRRPVLLVSTAGAAIAYALFAIGSGVASHRAALGIILLSRIFAGICGGNIGVAQAYIADISPPEVRSKRMGLIGMAFGLGFIFGPVIGGLSLAHIGDQGPGWIACGLCSANFLLAFWKLAESRKAGSDEAPKRPHIQQALHTLRKPKVGLLVITFFLATFCFSCFESTLALLVSVTFHLDILSDPRSASTVVYLYAFCGIIGAFVQGGAIGKLVKRLGEPKLIAGSLIITGVAMAPLPFITGNNPLSWSVFFQPGGMSWAILLAVLAVLSVGSALTRPPLFGMLSILTPEHEQGETIGVAQSAGSLARILGPIFAAPVFGSRPAMPFLVCSVVAILTGLWVLKGLQPRRAEVK